jgi:hypothetical protein
MFSIFHRNIEVVFHAREHFVLLGLIEPIDCNAIAVSEEDFERVAARCMRPNRSADVARRDCERV